MLAKGGGGVRQMLPIDDEGGGGVRQMLTVDGTFPLMRARNQSFVGAKCPSVFHFPISYFIFHPFPLLWD